jgi:drug/metabolite transporter (DMT)-like permease
MALFAVLVAGSFGLGGQIARDINPAVLTALRFWIAAGLIGILAHRLVGLRPDHAAAPWRYLILGGLFGIYFVTMFEGLKTAPPVSSAAVFTLTPIMSGLFGFLLLRQRMTRRMAGALALGGAGALWVIFRADIGALMVFDVGRGEVIFFCGCIAHALYTPLVPTLNRGEPPLVFTFGMTLAGGTLVTLYALPAFAETDWSALRPMVWITIGYLAVFASATTFLLVQFAALRLPSAKVMAYTYLTPSVVLVWEFGLNGTLPPLAVLLGIAATIAALLLLLKE